MQYLRDLKVPYLISGYNLLDKSSYADMKL